VGNLDAQGHLYFEGRLGGMIKTSGANVSPEEVEAAIRLIDGVIDVAVFGLPHPKLGQIVVAVACTTQASGLDEAGLRARLRGQISAFMIPRRVLFLDLDDFPRTPSNKIRKPALAMQVEPLWGDL